MYDKEKVIKSIDPEGLYSATDLVRGNMLPDVKTYPTILGRVREDLMLPERERVLKALKVGTGRATHYVIKGRNLINYLKLYEQRQTLYRRGSEKTGRSDKK